MKKIAIILALLQGALMASIIKDIEIKGNSVPIVFEKGDYLPIISIQLVFKNAGHLSNSIDGLADISANILNEGTKTDGSIGFATKLDAHAIDIHAGVGRESFVIELSSLKSEFAYAIDRLEELIKDPNFTQKALSQVKHQKIGWLNRKKSDFDYIAGTALRASIFKGSDLARPYSGTFETVESISLDNVKDFISSKLGYNNVIAVVGGDISFDEAQNYLKRVLTLFPKVEEGEIKSINASDKKDLILIEEDTQQAYIYFGSPFNFSYKEKNQHIVKIAEYLLGGAGFGSRLMEEIRVKRGLTYSIYAALRRTKSVSYLSGYMQTKLSTQDEAKDLIQKVVDDFIKDGITQKELDETKKFLLGSEPLRTETLSQRLGRAYNNYYYERGQNFDKEQLKNIESVSLDEVNSFIKSHRELSDISFAIVTKIEN